MAVYREEYEDVLKQCPYDPNHMVASRRFAIHLKECERRPTAPSLVTCKYNSQHRFSQQAIQIHYLTCPDAKQALRGAIEGQQASMLGDTHSKFLAVEGRKAGDPDDDPWASEGQAAGVKDFLVKGLSQGPVDMDALTDIDKHIDNIMYQRCTPLEKRQVTQTRAQKAKQRMQEEAAKEKREASQATSTTNVFKTSVDRFKPYQRNSSVTSADNSIISSQQMSRRAGGIGRGTPVSTNDSNTSVPGVSPVVSHEKESS